MPIHDNSFQPHENIDLVFVKQVCNDVWQMTTRAESDWELASSQWQRLLWNSGVSAWYDSINSRSPAWDLGCGAFHRCSSTDLSLHWNDKVTDETIDYTTARWFKIQTTTEEVNREWFICTWHSWIGHWFTCPKLECPSWLASCKPPVCAFCGCSGVSHTNEGQSNNTRDTFFIRISHCSVLKTLQKIVQYIAIFYNANRTYCNIRHQQYNILQYNSTKIQYTGNNILQYISVAMNCCGALDRARIL